LQEENNCFFLKGYIFSVQKLEKVLCNPGKGKKNEKEARAIVYPYFTLKWHAILNEVVKKSPGPCKKIFQNIIWQCKPSNDLRESTEAFYGTLKKIRSLILT